MSHIKLPDGHVVMERPILFSAEMVRAILDGKKTQTRRIVKLPPAPTRLGEWEPSTLGGKGVFYSDGQPAEEYVCIWHTRTGKVIACPYGKPGDYLWYSHSEGENHYDGNTNGPGGVAETHSSVSERRLHGRGGRADILPHKVQGVRQEGVDGLVSTARPHDEQRVQVGQSVSRKHQGDEVSSSPDLYGVSRGTENTISASATLGRQPEQQLADESDMGLPVRELGGQEISRESSLRRGSSRGKNDEYGTRSLALGNQQGPLQSKTRRQDVEDVAVSDSRNRQGGDVLWVRESWATERQYDHLAPKNLPFLARIHYIADGSVPAWAGRSRPSIHMPRWASRIDLEITNIRVERLNDISEKDATAEGVDQVPFPPWRNRWKSYDPKSSDPWLSPKESYISLWEKINGKGSWAKNEWVWVVEFQKVGAS